MRANDVHDVSYDITLGNYDHAVQTFQQNSVTFIYLSLYSIGILKFSLQKIRKLPSTPFWLDQFVHIYRNIASKKGQAGGWGWGVSGIVKVHDIILVWLG